MIGKDVSIAVNYLNTKKLVAIPTETVYGLAGNALSEEAVASIFAVKNRPSFDPLIVHIGRPEMITEYCQKVPSMAKRLAEAFMPGPLTLLLPKRPIIPDIVTAGLSMVAIRIPNHPLTLELLNRLDFPLAAPSANPFGYISPTTAQHVEAQLGDQIPYILDGGPCTIGLESTIVGIYDGQRPVVHRKGGIATEAIEAIVGPVEVKAHSTSNPNAPGMLKSHYAPRVPLVIGNIEELLAANKDKKIGVISFQQWYQDIPQANQVVLTKTGDFKEAARNLFAGMRRLDEQDLDLIVTELVPDQDLGRAINDRLLRAAA